MALRWARTETIPGYARAYQSGVLRVAFEPIAQGQIYLRRDLFVDGIDEAIPLPPVFVEGLASLNDHFYVNSLSTAYWHIVAAVEKFL